MPSSKPWILHPSLGPLTDIPVERPSVGGMGSPTMGSQYPENETRFRPYVYRGTGRDIYEEPPPPRRKRKHDPAKIRAANIKRARTYRKPKPPKVYKTPEELAAIRAEAGRKRSERAAQRRIERERYQREWAAEMEERKRQRAVKDHKPYAMPDWKPPTGDDIEALLNELED